MTILDLTLKKETEHYKFFAVHYTPWHNSKSIKFRSGFVMKSTGDCHWSDTGKRLMAHTERAILSWIEDIETKSPTYLQAIGRANCGSNKPESDSNKLYHY